MKRSVVLLLAVVGVALALGLVWLALIPRQDTTTPTTIESTTMPTETGVPASSDAAQQQVVIQNRAFSPAKLTIKKGGQVTWINQDEVKHNVVADDEANSGGLPGDADLLAKGESYSHTFDAVGTFTYHCGPHPDMKGTIEVVE